MRLHTEQTTCNSIDLLDEDGNVMASVLGAEEGDSSITKKEEILAQRLCRAFNDKFGR